MFWCAKWFLWLTGHWSSIWLWFWLLINTINNRLILVNMLASYIIFLNLLFFWAIIISLWGWIRILIIFHFSISILVGKHYTSIFLWFFIFNLILTIPCPVKQYLLIPSRWIDINKIHPTTNLFWFFRSLSTTPLVFIFYHFKIQIYSIN